MSLFGCFRIEEIRDKDNETGLKEKGETLYLLTYFTRNSAVQKSKSERIEQM